MSMVAKKINQVEQKFSGPDMEIIFNRRNVSKILSEVVILQLFPRVFSPLHLTGGEVTVSFKFRSELVTTNATLSMLPVETRGESKQFVTIGRESLSTDSEIHE